jgi:NADH dehydrogenase FAD-containing subunit
VEAVVELLPYLAGLTRNRVQCLDDFEIPLLLSHTVTKIEGKRRVEGVRIAQVDDQRRPIPATEQLIPCDTLLLSVGLIPENELTRAAGIAMDPITNGPAVDQHLQTSRPGVFACGNVVHVNDLVDNVTAESRAAGAAAARYAQGKLPAAETVPTHPGTGVRYVCPQHLTAEEGKATLWFRVTAPGGKTVLIARCGEKELARRTVPRVSPGEMCRLDIDTGDLCGAVTVEAQEVE